MHEPGNPLFIHLDDDLRNSDERLQTLIDASPDIICFKDAEGRWMQANNSLLSLYCLTGVDYRGKTEFELADFTALMYQEAFRNCQGSDDQAWELGTTSRTVEEIPDIHGVVHVFDVVKVPLYFPDGSRKGIVVFGRDISDIKHTETALRESREKYRQIAEYTSDVIWMMNAQLHYTYVSPSIFKQRGYTPEEFVKLRPEEVYSGESLTRVQNLYRSSIALAKEGKIPGDYSVTIELQHRCKDGSCRDSEVMVSPVFDISGNLIGGHGVSRDITERKQSEKALRESEDKFRGFFENAPIGIWEEDFSEVKTTIDSWKSSGIDIREHLSDLQHVKELSSLVKVIDINQAGLEISGQQDKEAVVRSLPHYFLEDSYPAFRDELIALAEGQTTFNCEIPVRSPQGARILSLNLAIQPGYDTTWGRVLVSFVDITTRREAERKITMLAELQSKLLRLNELPEIHELVVETVYRLIGDGIVFTTNIDQESASGGLVSFRGLDLPVISSLTQMLGLDPRRIKFYLEDCTAEELKIYRSGKFEILPGGLYALVTRRYSKVIMQGVEKLLSVHHIYTIGFTYQELHLGGLIILARGDLSAHAETIEMIVNQASISMNRIKAETALKEMQERFRLSFQTSPDAININNLETGLYVEVNEGFCSITGYSRENVIGRTAYEINIWDNPADRARMVTLLREHGKVTNFEAVFRFKDGTRHTGLMSAAVIHLNGVSHIISISRDIENIKQAERDLLRAKEVAEEASRLKTAFLNNISHEVRTPMNAILGFTEILQSDEPSAPERERYFGIVNTNAKQLLSIIDDVLEVSRMDSGKILLSPVVFSIRELMADIHLSMNEVVTKKGLDFSYLVDEQGQKGCVIADLEKVRQVMTGLIGNAVKFTDSGSILFGCTKSEKTLDFFVQDTGLGIEIEEQERIFDRFYQVRQDPGLGVRGTGLGLSIARGLAEVMGGDIQVESTPGQGSVFKLSIPFKKAEQKDVSPASELHSTMDILTILVAEDEDFNYELMEILLAKKVRRLIRASNGTEVLSILQREKPDLVLMDLKMPEMDGYEATRRARAIYPDLRIIALTAYTQPEDEHRAMAAGCCAFISKPIRKQELFETIRKNAQ